MIKEFIEDHLECDREMIENQAGFTSGGRVEDNLYLLNYCVQDSYDKKKPLFVTAIDYAKASDSVKRSKLIEVKKKYRIHPDKIDSVAPIYRKDSTRIKLNSSTEKP